MIEVECPSHDPNQVGDNGRALGILQIHPITVRDCNLIQKEITYILKDRADFAKSIEMFYIITNYYSRGLSNEVKARKWNQGPDAIIKGEGQKYWAKVQEHLRS